MTRPPSTMPRPNRIGAFAVQRFVVEPADAGAASVVASVVAFVVSVIGAPVGSRAPRGRGHVAAVLSVVARVGRRFPLHHPSDDGRTLPIGGEVAAMSGLPARRPTIGALAAAAVLLGVAVTTQQSSAGAAGPKP